MTDPVRFLEPNPDSPKDRNTIWFEWITEKNDAASDAAGVPLFDQVLLAHVIGPGMGKSEAVIACERVKPDKSVVVNQAASQRYGEMIKAFKSGDTVALTGTPLTELVAVDMSTRATLQAMGVHSIEALAAMNETAQPLLMGFRKFKTAAQAYIDQRDGQAPVAKLTAELEAEKEKNRLLQANFDDLAARVSAMEEGGETPAKRGKMKAAA